jgi:hypothetical protein
MNNRLRYYQILDDHPFVGKIKIKPPIKVRLVDNALTKPFFDGSDDVEQITNLTFGKTYEIFEIEGFGDMSDVSVIDDNGEVDEFISNFFEEVL